MSEKYVLSTLEKLCCAAGVGGQTAIQDIAQELLGQYTDDITVDAAGNITATLHSADENASAVLLEAHMDEIGFVVTQICDNGFLKVSACGGVDYRCLAATAVTVYGKESLTGVFCSIPPHLIGEKKDKNIVDKEALYVDVGLSYDEVKGKIAVGDRVAFRANFAALDEHHVTSKALDNRAGMAAVLYALSLLKDKALPCTIKVLFATGEELGCRGAVTGAFAADVQTALVTDVSFAYQKGCENEMCGEMGKGAMIGISPVLSPRVTEVVFSAAEQNKISYQREVTGQNTGTDADVISKSRTGIPTALLSIPLRYMHTPIELMDIRDVMSVGSIMAAYIEKGGCTL